MSSAAPMQHVKTDATPTAQRSNQPSSQLATQRQQSDTTIQSEFTDQRPQATTQRQLQNAANNSPQNRQLQAFHQMAQNSTRATQLKTMGAMMKAPTVQRTEEDDEPLQVKSAGEPLQREATADAADAPKQNNTGLPDHLKSGIESLSGMSMNHVKVHYNSSQPAQLNAHAYAQGSEIHVGLGQEQHLPHEAWHVVQQAQGRVQPTMQMKAGVPVNDDVGLEAEADVMGKRAIQMDTSLDVGVLEQTPPPVKTNIMALPAGSTSGKMPDAPTLERMTPDERKEGARTYLEAHINNGMKGSSITAMFPQVKQGFGLSKLALDFTDPVRPAIAYHASPPIFTYFSAIDKVSVTETEFEEATDIINRQDTPAVTKITEVTAARNLPTALGVIKQEGFTILNKKPMTENRFNADRPGSIKAEVTGKRFGKERGGTEKTDLFGHLGRFENKITTGNDDVDYAGGHLIAWQLAGKSSMEADNLAPQVTFFNSPRYRDVFEMALRKADTTATIDVTVSLGYADQSFEVDQQHLVNAKVISAIDLNKPWILRIPRRVPNTWHAEATLRGGGNIDNKDVKVAGSGQEGIFVEDISTFSLGTLVSKGDRFQFAVSTATAPIKKTGSRKKTHRQIGGANVLTFVANQYYPPAPGVRTKPVNVKGKDKGGGVTGDEHALINSIAVKTAAGGALSITLMENNTTLQEIQTSLDLYSHQLDTATHEGLAQESLQLGDRNIDRLEQIIQLVQSRENDAWQATAAFMNLKTQISIVKTELDDCTIKLAGFDKIVLTPKLKVIKDQADIDVTHLKASLTLQERSLETLLALAQKIDIDSKTLGQNAETLKTQKKDKRKERSYSEVSDADESGDDSEQNNEYYSAKKKLKVRKSKN